MSGEPAFMVAEEMGLRIIEAADRVLEMSKVVPGTVGRFSFELDGTSFDVAIQRTPKPEPS